MTRDRRSRIEADQFMLKPFDPKGLLTHVETLMDERIAAMARDPIVEEVRKIRESLASEHGYDLDAIVRALQRIGNNGP